MASDEVQPDYRGLVPDEVLAYATLPSTRLVHEPPTEDLRLLKRVEAVAWSFIDSPFGMGSLDEGTNFHLPKALKRLKAKALNQSPLGYYECFVTHYQFIFYLHLRQQQRRPKEVYTKFTLRQQAEFDKLARLINDEEWLSDKQCELLINSFRVAGGSDTNLDRKIDKSVTQMMQTVRFLLDEKEDSIFSCLTGSLALLVSPLEDYFKLKVLQETVGAWKIVAYGVTNAIGEDMEVYISRNNRVFENTTVMVDSILQNMGVVNQITNWLHDFNFVSHWDCKKELLCLGGFQLGVGNIAAFFEHMVKQSFELMDTCTLSLHQDVVRGWGNRWVYDDYHLDLPGYSFVYDKWNAFPNDKCVNYAYDNAALEIAALVKLKSVSNDYSDLANFSSMVQAAMVKPMVEKFSELDQLTGMILVLATCCFDGVVTINEIIDSTYMNTTRPRTLLMFQGRCNIRRDYMSRGEFPWIVSELIARMLTVIRPMQIRLAKKLIELKKEQKEELQGLTIPDHLVHQLSVYSFAGLKGKFSIADLNMDMKRITKDMFGSIITPRLWEYFMDSIIKRAKVKDYCEIFGLNSLAVEMSKLLKYYVVPLHARDPPDDPTRTPEKLRNGIPDVSVLLQEGKRQSDLESLFDGEDDAGSENGRRSRSMSQSEVEVASVVENVGNFPIDVDVETEQADNSGLFVDSNENLTEVQPGDSTNGERRKVIDTEERVEEQVNTSGKEKGSAVNDSIKPGMPPPFQQTGKKTDVLGPKGPSESKVKKPEPSFLRSHKPQLSGSKPILLKPWTARATLEQISTADKSSDQAKEESTQKEDVFENVDDSDSENSLFVGSDDDDLKKSRPNPRAETAPSSTTAVTSPKVRSSGFKAINRNFSQSSTSRKKEDRSTANKRPREPVLQNDKQTASYGDEGEGKPEPKPPTPPPPPSPPPAPRAAENVKRPRYHGGNLDQLENLFVTYNRTENYGSYNVDEKVASINETQESFEYFEALEPNELVLQGLDQLKSKNSDLTKAFEHYRLEEIVNYAMPASNQHRLHDMLVCIESIPSRYLLFLLPLLFDQRPTLVMCPDELVMKEVFEVAGGCGIHFRNLDLFDHTKQQMRVLEQDKLLVGTYTTKGINEAQWALQNQIHPSRMVILEPLAAVLCQPKTLPTLVKTAKKQGASQLIYLGTTFPVYMHRFLKSLNCDNKLAFFRQPAIRPGLSYTAMHDKKDKEKCWNEVRRFLLDDSKMSFAARYLTNPHSTRVVIYCPTIEFCDSVKKYANRLLAGVGGLQSVCSVFKGNSKQERDKVLQQWCQGQSPVLITTPDHFRDVYHPRSHVIFYGELSSFGLLLHEADRVSKSVLHFGFVHCVSFKESGWNLCNSNVGINAVDQEFANMYVFAPRNSRFCRRLVINTVSGTDQACKDTGMRRWCDICTDESQDDEEVGIQIPASQGAKAWAVVTRRIGAGYLCVNCGKITAEPCAGTCLHTFKSDVTRLLRQARMRICSIRDVLGATYEITDLSNCPEWLKWAEQGGDVRCKYCVVFLSTNYEYALLDTYHLPVCRLKNALPQAMLGLCFALAIINNTHPSERFAPSYGLANFHLWKAIFEIAIKMRGWGNGDSRLEIREAVTPRDVFESFMNQVGRMKELPLVNGGLMVLDRYIAKMGDNLKKA